MKFLLFISLLALRTSRNILPFEAMPVSVEIKPGIIDEASGIADSHKNPGYLWVEQDSGNPADLFLLSYSGTVTKKFHINGVANRDWEDLTIANGPEEGVNYIYIAETGDNYAVDPSYAIYRFPEPAINADNSITAEKIIFKYPDGSHDAEALWLDNETKDIYIITKRDSSSRIYKLPYPQDTASMMIAVSVGRLPFMGVVSAAISPDQNELLIKTYTEIYYWKRKASESMLDALKRTPITLGYSLEPQGEAVCFKNDNSAFFTLSERPFFVSSIELNLYKRKDKN